MRHKRHKDRDEGLKGIRDTWIRNTATVGYAKDELTRVTSMDRRTIQRIKNDHRNLH